MRNHDLIGTLSDVGTLQGTLQAGTEYLEGDLSTYINIPKNHVDLLGRDEPDQHPIGAITGLQDALDSKLSAIDISIIYCGTSTEVV